MNVPVRDEQGFALFEAIVALALAALALSAIYRSVGDAVRAADAVRTKSSGLALARTQLGSLAADGTIQPGVSTGTYANGSTWRLTVSPLTRRAAAGNAAQPYWVVLEAFDRRGGPLVRLETARVARDEE